MLRSSLNLILRSNIQRDCSTTISTTKWDLMTAVCLERKPIITPKPNDIQKRMLALLQEVELEKSYKSDHELRHETDKLKAELLKKSEGDLDLDVTLAETAQDFEDVSLQELNKFELASRITSDDKSNNVKSLDRKLEKHLVLLINQQIGDKKYYLLPQGLRQDGEALRQTAERILKENCPDVKANFLGNAPAGFYKYKYPKIVQNQSGVIGAKVFIYFAHYVKGNLPNKIDYKWLDRDELNKELPSPYHTSVAQFLIDE